MFNSRPENLRKGSFDRLSHNQFAKISFVVALGLGLPIMFNSQALAVSAMSKAPVKHSMSKMHAIPKKNATAKHTAQKENTGSVKSAAKRKASANQNAKQSSPKQAAVSTDKAQDDSPRVKELTYQVKRLSSRVDDLTNEIKLLNEQLRQQNKLPVTPTATPGKQTKSTPSLPIKPPVDEAVKGSVKVPGKEPGKESTKPVKAPTKPVKGSIAPAVDTPKQSIPTAPPVSKGPPLLPKVASTSGVPVPWKSVPASSGSAVPAPFAASVDVNVQSAIRELRSKHLSIPVDGITAESMKGSFYQSRGARQHNAADMLSPRNTPIKAVEDGTIGRLFTSAAGGITIYQKDPSGKYVYYYAHLERYADNLQNGDVVKRNQIIGYVGTTGNAPPNTPHLHFAISKAGEGGNLFHGTPIDPYEVYR